ncbi:class I SAM-dependent methyltransferase [Vibrio agarivorans]|uniref:DUF4942 domain-containing protein n=1 Tax=Vibrio agarivorans TaxID=153622 RepID=A0ABT7Y755_9VIBR|nr:DUF4942 domain-containing protein [Vibrio agarivorans]MDN2483878.1 DUF4942 domain-containing protein [Vibrio agarivorans]
MLSLNQAPIEQEQPLSLKQILSLVSGTPEDYEYYPTTEAMLATVKEHCASDYSTWLDIGAGAGHALMSLTNNPKGRFAIEKSTPLIAQMDHSVVLLGTDFAEQTLIDLPTDYVFCNPPYSEFETFLTRIIKEAHARGVYAIVPSRWKASKSVQRAIELRKAEVTVIDSTDFLNAPRSARAKVDILFIDLKPSRYENGNLYNRYHSKGVDPFNVWFEETFKFNCDKKTEAEYVQQASRASSLKDRVGELSDGHDLVGNLVQWYEKELGHICENYHTLSGLDAAVLKEVGVDLESVKEALKKRISGLKHLYWNEFFSNFSKITDTLTASSREAFLARLQDNRSIDFTRRNCHAIALQCLKVANCYHDNQLLDVFDDLASGASVVNYKSNERTFSKREWRWSKTREEITHYGLDLRVIADNRGAINHSRYSFDAQNGLDKSGHRFIGDLLTVANNLGFDSTGPEHLSSTQKHWDSNVLHEFTYTCSQTGETQTLFTVRAFMKGSMHFKFNQKFLLAMNVTVGRLKGWLYDTAQASSELNVAETEIAQVWDSTIKFELNGVQTALLTTK